MVAALRDYANAFCQSIAGGCIWLSHTKSMLHPLDVHFKRPSVIHSLLDDLLMCEAQWTSPKNQPCVYCPRHPYSSIIAPFPSFLHHHWLLDRLWFDWFIFPSPSSCIPSWGFRLCSHLFWPLLWCIYRSSMNYPLPLFFSNYYPWII